MEEDKKNAVYVKFDVSLAEQEIDRLQEKANRLKATLKEIGVTADSLRQNQKER